MGANDKPLLFGPTGHPTNQPEREYKLADLAVSTNGTAAQIMASCQGQWHASAVAVFVACSVEFDKRDQELAGLRERLEKTAGHLVAALEQIEHSQKRIDELVVQVGSTAMQRNASAVPEHVSENNTTRVEVDPEEAERDYLERRRKIGAYFAKFPIVRGAAMAGTGIKRTLDMDGEPGDRPTLEELRDIERYLNVHEGVDWYS